MQVKRVYVAFEYHVEIPLCKVVTKVFLTQRYARCLPNHTFLLSQGWIMGSKAWIHYWAYAIYNFVMLGIIFQSVCQEWLYIDDVYVKWILDQ
jgi:hypothetical protein